MFRVVVICFIALFAMAAVQAEFVSERSLSAKVPFQFAVPGAKMPAGGYRISSIGFGAGDVLRIINVESGQGVYVLTPVRQENLRNESARLRFACLNGNCVLSDAVGLIPGAALRVDPKFVRKTLGIQKPAELVNVPMD